MQGFSGTSRPRLETMAKVKVEGGDAARTARVLARNSRAKRPDQGERWGNGAQGRNRTTDTAIFSRMLYQLSYLGPGRRKASSTASAL